MSDLKIGEIDLLLAAGAHDQFVAYVVEYPDGDFAETVRTAISMDALDEFEAFAGSACGRFFDGGIDAVGNLDVGKQAKARELFGEENVPEYMRSDSDQ